MSQARNVPRGNRTPWRLLISLATGTQGYTHLENSNHEPVGHDFRVALCSVLEKSEDAPAKIQGRNEDVHGDSRKQVDEGKKADYISDNEDCLKLNQLISMKAELIRHSRNVGIVCNVLALAKSKIHSLTTY